MAKMNFGGIIEEVMTREEFPLEKAREVLKNETIAVLGYGVQGPGQACNLRDNGFNVIVGQRPGKTYDKAVADGWIPGETLFSLEEAAQKGTIVCMLLSDAAQMQFIRMQVVKPQKRFLLLVLELVRDIFLKQHFNVRQLQILQENVALLWEQFRDFCLLSMKCFVKMVILLLKPSMKQLRN